MNEQETRNNEIMEIDMKRLAQTVVNKGWLIAVVAVLCAVIAFLGTFYFITPQYRSSAMFYVNNSSLSVGDASFSISTGDISASKSLVNTYIVILKTRETLNDVIDYAGVDRSSGELAGMIRAESVGETQIFRISVTSPDPVEAEKIADAIAYILPKRITSIVEGTSAKIVDSAVLPAGPSSPSYSRNTVLGFVLGAILVVIVLVLRELFNVTIRTEEDIARISSYPVLASVPDMEAPSKGGYYHSYSQNNMDKKRGGAGRSGEHVLVGGGISFAATEAYKLLRTKLQYSFADENTCRVIGVSSALSGEGKSLSAINLAYSLSQLDKKVLLIDCDMRRPSLSSKLPIDKRTGLSGYLSGLHLLDEIIQKCGLKGEETAFDIISSGHNPPNPIELLSSDRMAKLLNALRKVYDYVILDLPPVGEVSDALAVAKRTDGVLLVVRRNYSERSALGAAVRQFAFVESKILGFVYNCAAQTDGTYAKSYYKRSYGRYAGKYASTGADAAGTEPEQENG